MRDHQRLILNSASADQRIDSLHSTISDYIVSEQECA